ncbi:MAG TPA: SAM-dependent methyltransferase [Ferruginibacter sp.]|nr:SAM-dependent methyltransferase [Bacteroidota bacterium]MCC6692398.1 SAM-dependent methyltransferase [Chitinophagaceae bacterium]HMT97094.1 SAM-dependent methyltransferase [Ferruginibacter sp.]MBS1925124.1 SAM-dependent methyltransferase [Bacteroidota bacterium]HMU23968.1 SAM-dependent methyltransferase [Ferruginibacter sp.]
MSNIYLIPSLLAQEATETIPAYVLKAVEACTVIFAENERTARRFLKKINKDIVIDRFEWFSIHNREEAETINFRQKIKENKNIAIISEAGCPGVADPGQKLVSIAQEMNCTVKPLVGPNAILLALMASGLNGQQFEFCGYLPVENEKRVKKIKELETGSAKNHCTKIFIETPYRNDQLLDAFLNHCKPSSRLCIAANLTAPQERIKTQSIADWKKNKPQLNKQPVMFLLLAQ